MNRYLSVVLFQTTEPVTLPPVAGRQLYGWEAAALLPLIDLEKSLNNPGMSLHLRSMILGYRSKTVADFFFLSCVFPPNEQKATPI